MIGVPDEIRGENIHAFIVLRPGYQLDRETVIAHCTKMIARYKVPREVTFLEELPLTASGKIRRFELRALRASARPTPEYLLEIRLNK